MTWPPELIAAFAQALHIEPENGTPKDQLIVALLETATRRIVWRAGGDPTRVTAAMRSPYTPLGSVVGERIDGRVKSLTLKGDRWKPAVDAYYDFMDKNAAAVFDAFAGQGEEYHDGLT